MAHKHLHFQVSVLLLLPQISRVVPSMGSSRIARMSNSSMADFAHGSLGTWVSPASLFFLGLPLLWGIFCWGDRASNILPSSTTLPASASARAVLPFPWVEGNLLLDPWGCLLQVEMNPSYFPVALTPPPTTI
jgi:hypothetical protein